jgi:hypothetical protein
MKNSLTRHGEKIIITLSGEKTKIAFLSPYSTGVTILVVDNT